jgi:abortive infection bacteriophage resistance protein
MEYAKPPLTLTQQVGLLLQRGMTGDPVLMASRLASVNYYRLSGYWYPFRNPDDTFRPGTSFERVWERYVFDRRLRLLVMDAIERIEVAVRSFLAYRHAHHHGAFAYAENPGSLPKMSSAEHSGFLQKVEEESARGREAFVRHFRGKYGDCHRHLPIWMATEIMAFGTVLTFYRGSSHRVKQQVATEFGVPWFVLDSWLLTLGAVRNICAHHGRLWNRENGVKPAIPRCRDYPDWHVPIEIDNARVFAVLSICRHCLRRVAPQSRWADRLKALLREFPSVPQVSMGIPPNWQESPIWREEGEA